MHATMHFSPGLENVIAAETAISTIDGEAGKIIYRGYDATELAYKRDFESVWHLLLHGELPTADEHAALLQDAHQWLELPQATLNVIRQ